MISGEEVLLKMNHYAIRFFDGTFDGTTRQRLFISDCGQYTYSNRNLPNPMNFLGIENDPPTIFDDIIANKIPAEIIYEDKLV